MPQKLKVVFDSNIYLSAIIFGGNPRQCLELARAREIELFTSRAILLEVSRNLQDKFGWQIRDVKESVEAIGEFVNIILPAINVKVIKSKATDNRILEAAIAARADYLVTGDKKHLFPLKTFKDIPIISAKEFLEIFYES